MPRKRQKDDTASDVDVHTDKYAMELIELATNDEELRQRISDSFTIQLVPAWLDTTSDVRGFPSQVDFSRKELLVAKYTLPANGNEERLVRNRAAIDDLVLQNAVVLGPGSIQVRFDRRDSGVGMNGIENGGRAPVNDAEALGERQVVHVVRHESTPPPFHPVNPTQPRESGSSMYALDVRLLELAVSDSDFRLRLNIQQSFHELNLSAPGWLNTTASVIGDPSRITEERFQALSEWVAPRTDDERRLVRNRAAIMEVQSQILANAGVHPAQDVSAAAQVIQNPFPFVVAEQNAVMANGHSGQPMAAVETMPGDTPDEDDFIKLARNDDELFHRINTSECFGRCDFQWPEWLSYNIGSNGFPSLIEPARLQRLRQGSPVKNPNEHRFVRNHAVFQEIQAQLINDVGDDVQIKKEPQEDTFDNDGTQFEHTEVESAHIHQSTESMDLDAARAIDLLSSYILEMEYAENDDDLQFHFRNIESVARANGLRLWLKYPRWLAGDEAPRLEGYPTQISSGRQQELRMGQEPSNSIHEHRFVRNLNGMMDIVSQIEVQAAGVEAAIGPGMMPRRPLTKAEQITMRTQRRREKPLVRLRGPVPAPRDNVEDKTDNTHDGELHFRINGLATMARRLRRSKRLASRETSKPIQLTDHELQYLEVRDSIPDMPYLTKKEEKAAMQAESELAPWHPSLNQPTTDAQQSLEHAHFELGTVCGHTKDERFMPDGAKVKVHRQLTRTAPHRINVIKPKKRDTFDQATLRTVFTSGTDIMHEATTDEDLRQRVLQLASVHHFSIRVPDLVADPENYGPLGYPELVPKDRRLLLEQGESAKNADEDRLLRNLAVALSVEAQIQRKIEERSRRDKERKMQSRNVMTARPAQNRPQELRQALEALKVSDGQASTPPGSAPKEPQDSPQLPKQTASVDVEQLKATALAPFYQRIQQDSTTITQLREENETLKATLAKPQQARKRKASMTPPSTSDEDVEDARTYQPLANLVKDFFKALGEATANESIQLCGLAPLQIISTRPQEVQQLAYDKLHTWRFDNVPPQWRRLHEDACLHIAAGLLKELSTQALPAMNKNKRVKLGQDDKSFEAKIAKIVKELDSAVIISGAPGRRSLIEATFRQLETIMRFFLPTSPPQQMVVLRSHELGIQDADLHSHIKRAPQAWSVDAFQVHLDKYGGPVIIPKSFLHWPACQKWQDLSYLKRNTLGGHRIVPVELGSSYTEEDWGSRFMTFNEYAEKYLSPAEPKEIGYLAQHNLFDQIPELRKDITIPDYCHSIPPPVRGAAAKTFGLDSVRQLDEPELNAWLGPKGTKTPLHTDAYHNILCQVVGYKYVRLYSPEQVGKLYPVGVDETGVNMSNTSLVDIWPFVPRRGEIPDHRKIQDLREEFPLFETAEYQEAILAPGECLYIPLGWWHYVESLSTSFSVSFWWN